MGKWFTRGLALAALMVVVRLVQSTLINQFETKAGLISISLLVVFGIVVLLWGWIDGRTDARANIDPDRREDLAMTWMLAGLFAGLLSGVVTWLISLAYAPLYNGGLMNEITTFAAFTALLVFLPGVLGVALGRWLVDRNAPEFDRKAASAEADRASTDVFAAVQDDTPTGEIPVATVADYDGEYAAENRESSVALAESDQAADAVDQDRRRD
jgi:MFS family permease